MELLTCCTGLRKGLRQPRSESSEERLEATEPFDEQAFITPPDLFEPLQGSQALIRLLRLDRLSTTSTSVTLSFVHVLASLDEQPEFHVVSYECNSQPRLPVKEIQVELNGRRVPVKPNLRCFLGTVYVTADRASLLWNDALCINASDLVERRHQLLLLTRIFAQARNVLVWLGPKSEDSTTALRLCARLAQLQGTNPGWGKSMQWVQRNWGKRRYQTSWDSLARLCQRSYWRRLWTVQECALNLRTMIFCGSTSTHIWGLWLAVRSFAELASDNTMRFMRSIDDLRFVSTMYRLDQRYKVATEYYYDQELADVPLRDRYINLLRLRVAFRDHQCYDPRDHIYGILGLVPQTEEAKMVVDYTISLDEVCRRTAVYIITTNRNFALLQYCQPQLNELAAVPSWVPDLLSSDFARSGAAIEAGDSSISAGLPEYKHVSFSNDYRLLHCRARLVASVESTLVLEPIEGSADIVASLIERFELAAHFCLNETTVYQNPTHILRREDVDGLVHRTFSCCEAIFAGSLFSRPRPQELIAQNFLGHIDWDHYIGNPNSDLIELWASASLVGYFKLWMGRQGPLTDDDYDEIKQIATVAFSGGDNSCLVRCTLPGELESEYEGKAIGSSSPAVRQGDIVAVLDGSEFPIVLRPTGSGQHQVIKSAYFSALTGHKVVGVLPETDIILR